MVSTAFFSLNRVFSCGHYILCAYIFIFRSSQKHLVIFRFGAHFLCGQEKAIYFLDFVVVWAGLLRSSRKHHIRKGLQLWHASTRHSTSHQDWPALLGKESSRFSEALFIQTVLPTLHLLTAAFGLQQPLRQHLNSHFLSYFLFSFLWLLPTMIYFSKLDFVC